jgi:hypothetical protein
MLMLPHCQAKLPGYKTDYRIILTEIGLFYVSLFNWKGAKFRLMAKSIIATSRQRELQRAVPDQRPYHNQNNSYEPATGRLAVSIDRQS